MITSIPSSLISLIPVPLRAHVPFTHRNQKAKAWRSFAKSHRKSSTKLLGALATLNNTILVAGCQRSGGTLLTSLLNRHSSVHGYEDEGDQELAGAKILVGKDQIPGPIGRRHCFQTTYLNEHFTEYFQPYDFKLVWLVRNPKSVIRSMLDNWSHYALDELYEGSQQQVFLGEEPTFEVRSRLDKACFAYLAKNDQASQLSRRLSDKKFICVEYDHLVTNPSATLATIHEFLGLPFFPREAAHIRQSSLNKAQGLNSHEARLIDERCAESYESACLLVA